MSELRSAKITVIQGAVGDTEWWTEEDWERHRKHVEKLKASGEYLKPEEYTVVMVPHPLLDEPGIDASTMSCEMIILDTTKIKLP